MELIIQPYDLSCWGKRCVLQLWRLHLKCNAGKSLAVSRKRALLSTV
jgi:hypothetical protein